VNKMDTQTDYKERLREAESFKRLTFFAISISTVATLTAIIVVPMLYNYMQHVQSSLDEELEFLRTGRMAFGTNTAILPVI